MNKKRLKYWLLLCYNAGLNEVPKYRINDYIEEAKEELEK